MQETWPLYTEQSAREVAAELGLLFEAEWYQPGCFHDFMFTDPLNGTTFHVPVDSPNLFTATLLKLQKSRDSYYSTRLKARADQGDVAALVEYVNFERMLMRL